MYFSVFHNNFWDIEGTKISDPISESSLKTILNIVTFFAVKKIDKIKLRIKTDASLLPFSCVTFLTRYGYPYLLKTNTWFPSTGCIAMDILAYGIWLIVIWRNVVASFNQGIKEYQISTFKPFYPTLLKLLQNLESASSFYPERSKGC